MILLENCVPPVYVEESRDFQFFLRAFNVIFNMVKQDINTLSLITNTKECETRILPLLKTKLGFFTNYDMDDGILRWILRGFPYIIKNKGSLTSIQQAIYVFLKALNIKTKVIIKIVNTDSAEMEGSIVVPNHTILIAIESAVQEFYVLEELFKYIMPVGYQYSFYFYKSLDKETWLVDKNTGKFLIVDTWLSDSIRTENFYNKDQGIPEAYKDPFINKLMNQVNLIDVYSDTNYYTEEDDVIVLKDFVFIQLENEPEAFTEYYFYFYKKVDNKFVQLTSAETFEADKYYLPKMFFVNEEDIYVGPIQEDIMFDYKGSEKSLFEWKYYEFYEKGSDGRFRNLQQPPTQFEPDKYYMITSNRYLVYAEDVITYSAMPITSTYLSTVSSLAQ